MKKETKIKIVKRRYNKKSLFEKSGFEMMFEEMGKQILQSLTGTLVSKENAKTHKFDLHTDFGAIQCSQCNLIADKRKNRIWACEDISCNENIMKRVIE